MDIMDIICKVQKYSGIGGVVFSVLNCIFQSAVLLHIWYVFVGIFCLNIFGLLIYAIYSCCKDG